MAELRNPWRTFGKVALAIGVPLTAVALILAALAFVIEAAAFGLFISAGSVGINGLVWLIIGVCCWNYFKNLADRYNWLWNEGEHYDAEVLEIVQTNTFRFNRSCSAYAECSYKNSEGKICLVRSTLFMLDFNFYGNNEFAAKVYVNKRDPSDYFVDLALRGAEEIEADYDYR